MSASPIRIALVGLGKIARHQHLPAIRGDAAFNLAATVSPEPCGVDGVPHFSSVEILFADGPAIDAVVICTPPQVRQQLASAALARGVHVFLEKPPAASLCELAALEEHAAATGTTLFAGWHSRFAAGVEPARAWLAGRKILKATITWREDVRTWHPGQTWIWQAGGFGVFDPGINALSIATRILPHRIFLAGAELDYPANREAPIAARLAMRDEFGAEIDMDLDWRQTGPQTWDIAVETDAGRLMLGHGGALLTLPDGSQRGEDLEYPGLYARFATLIRSGTSDVDCTPLKLVADAFLRGRILRTAPFAD